MPARILVVEASHEVRTLIADVLTADGHDVKRVTNGVVSVLGGAFEGSGMRGEEVDPTTYFFRTIMRFETGAPYLKWLNRTIAVATAERKARRVLLSAHKLL